MQSVFLGYDHISYIHAKSIHPQRPQFSSSRRENPAVPAVGHAIPTHSASPLRDYKAVQQGLNGFKLIFEALRPTLDKKDERFEQDHQELLALAAKSNSPLASDLILKEISRLDPSGQ
jgi:hypothetical protein